MADTNILRGIVSKTVATVGPAALSALFPRDFEFYMVALELTTFDGETIEYFTFPVMPTSMTKSENERTSIYHTLGGTTIINTDSFVPKDLTIQGDFGRSFKIVLGDIANQAVTFKGLKFSNQNGVEYADQVNADVSFGRVPIFNFAVKTGFGCIKILQSIIDRAKGHDQGKPFRLYFYNLALGESYLVVPTKQPLTLMQNESKNMIWGYNLNLSIIAPLDRIEFASGSQARSLKSMLAQAVVQAAVNQVAKAAVKYVKSVVK